MNNKNDNVINRKYAFYKKVIANKNYSTKFKKRIWNFKN